MQESGGDIEKDHAAVAKVLGEPFMLEFTEPVRKMRTHLMIGSAVGLAFVFMGLKVSQSNTVLGLQFEGLTEKKMLLGLVLFNAYLLIHFLWSSADSFLEWRVRLTGARVTHQTGTMWSHESADYPADPRQSTLHNWWLASAKGMVNVPTTLAKIDTDVTKAMELVSLQLAPNQEPQWVNIQTLNQGIIQQLNAVNSTLHQTSKVLGDVRIPVSLERFDRTFYLFQKSQTFRWILIEWLTPTVLGTLAISLLIQRLIIS